jgi:hypothetical protein
MSNEPISREAKLLIQLGEMGGELWKARDWVFRLRKHRAIARNFGNQMERERNHWKRESLEQAKLLALSADREEKLRAKEAKR